MKISPQALPDFLKNPPETVRAVLLFGPDAGLAQMRAKMLAESVAGKTDPMRRRYLGGSEASGEAIARELAQPLLGGGKVALTIAGPFSGGRARVLPAALSNVLRLPTLEGMAILLGGDLPPSSGLRKLAEKESQMAAIGCYPDNPAQRARLIKGRIKQAGLTIAPQALEFLVERLGEDRGQSEQELAKLVLYKGDGQQYGSEISLEEALAVCAPPGLAAGETIAEAAALGETRLLLEHLARAKAGGLAPAIWLDASVLFFRRLHRLASALAAGQGYDQAARKLRPPIHFTRMAAVKNALTLWPPASAGEAFRQLAKAVAVLRQTNFASNGEALLLSLAQKARQQKKQQQKKRR